MPAITIEQDRTAVIAMDFQNQIIEMAPMMQERGSLAKVRRVLDAARGAGVKVGYVVVRFRPGYPEVSDRNMRFKANKEAGRLQEGTPGAEIPADLSPRSDEPVFVKKRVGPFTTTDIDTWLRANNVTKLVLMGIATSGVVLSTVRHASDLDFELIVLEDCCGDRDPEAHTCLIERIFPSQATIASADDFLAAVGQG